VASLDNANYQAEDATGTLEIAKADQTISFAAIADKTFGDADFAVDVSASSGLSVSLSADGQCAIVSGKVHITGAGSCEVTASQAGNGNYNAAAPVARSFAIAKAAATLSLSGLSATYDGSPKQVTVTTAPAGLSGVSVTYDGAAQAPANAGSYAVVASLDNANYQAEDATGTLEIAKATPTVDIVWANSTYDGAPKPASATVNGIGGNAISGASASLTYFAGADTNGTELSGAPTNAGTYTVRASFGGNDNYTSAATTKTITIAKANQTITFAQPTTPQLLGASFIVSPTSSAGLPVSVSGTAAVCSVQAASGGFTVTLTGVGTCTITASQTGNANYNAAPNLARAVASQYRWTGFFQPIDGTYETTIVTSSTVFNVAKAGSAIPVKFSLGGNQGLNIFVANSPSTLKVACPATTQSDAIEELATGTTSGLKYDAVADQYNYTWKTTTSYAGTCERLTVTLVDGTSHYAFFKFTK
jgi:hypothetical protein